jgi:hypothetical protein
LTAEQKGLSAVLNDSPITFTSIVSLIAMNAKNLSLLSFLCCLMLSGCSMQKRSLRSGWNIELNRNAPGSSQAEFSTNDGELEVKSSKHHGQLTGVKHTDPIVPLKALMAYSLPSEIPQDQPSLDRHVKVNLSSKIAHEVAENTAEPNKPDRVRFHGFRRLDKVVGALWWGSLSLLCFNSSGIFILLGLVFALLTFRSLAWAIASKSAWTKHIARRLLDRSFFPNTKISKGASNLSDNKSDAKRAEARQMREIQKERRKAKLKEFMESPTTKIISGLLGIIIVHALLF